VIVATLEQLRERHGSETLAVFRNECDMYRHTAVARAVDLGREKGAASYLMKLNSRLSASNIYSEKKQLSDGAFHASREGDLWPIGAQ
jgi:hypothetical protein